MEQPPQAPAEDPTQEARRLVQALMDKGLSAYDIAEKLDQRVSSRTVYRWAKGESTPQQSSDLERLRSIAAE
jgi:transposase